MTEPAPPGSSRGEGRSPSLARPYSWTEGRTQPTVELAIEALVQTTPEGGAVPYNNSNPQSMVVRLCLEPRSVAEIAALMSVPIGVVRVLVADLLDLGLVRVSSTLTDNASWDLRRQVLERVLSGLHRL